MFGLKRIVTQPRIELCLPFFMLSVVERQLDDAIDGG